MNVYNIYKNVIKKYKLSIKYNKKYIKSHRFNNKNFNIEI